MHSRCLDWTERYSQTARSKSRWAAIAGFMLVLMRPNTLSGAVQGCCWAAAPEVLALAMIAIRNARTTPSQSLIVAKRVPGLLVGRKGPPSTHV